MAPEYADVYRVEKLEWKGETAEIWRAVGRNGQYFALKRLRLDKLRDGAAVRSVYHEARVAGDLDHENIVAVYDCVPGPPSPTILMEFFPSRNLKVRVRAPKPDPLLLYNTRDVLQQMAVALNYVHLQGVIHMDIKPENFLLSDDGVVKLTDFALAQRERRGIRRLLPGRRRIAGTRPYIAPETLRRLAPDLRTDVYSFGATVFEMLTGRPPFISGDRDELLAMHLHQPPPWPTTFNKNLSGEISNFILAMLAKDPDRRPQSMADVVAHFKRLPIHLKPPEETPPSEAQR